VAVSGGLGEQDIAISQAGAAASSERAFCLSVLLRSQPDGRPTKLQYHLLVVRKLSPPRSGAGLCAVAMLPLTVNDPKTAALGNVSTEIQPVRDNNSSTLQFQSRFSTSFMSKAMDGKNRP
jgi:hypothetical protein